MFVYDNGTFNMTGGTISGNTAATYGGGVGVYSGTFTKTGGGIIYGDTDTTHTADTDENTAQNGNGHAAYVNSGPKKRDETAYEGDNMGSTQDEAAGILRD